MFKKNSNNKELAILVSEARKKLDISQRELSRRTGIDNAEISRIEAGTRSQPNFFTLRSLSKELKLSFKTLMELANYSKQDIAILLPLKNKEMPLLNRGTWTEELEKRDEILKKITIEKLVDKLKNGDVTTDDFIDILSYVMQTDVRSYFSKSK